MVINNKIYQIMEMMDYMHKTIYTTLILSAFLITGCGTKTIEKQYIHDFYTTEAAAVIVHEGVVNPAKEIVVVKKYERSKCPECKGTGKLVSGDGLSTKECPYCEVSKGSFGMLNNKCCAHCICDNCECKYPGECLIKKNNGWPVKVCKDDICEVYYPLDDQFERYDPFLLLTKEQQNSKIYFEHRHPTEIDNNGNPINDQNRTSSKDLPKD